MPAPAQIHEFAPHGWTPTALVSEGGEHLVEWIDLRGVSLDEPFFVDTLRRVRPERDTVRTPAAALVAIGPGRETVPLAGLILHTSRCGSTLACRMLAAIPEVLVISEPPLCDEVLRAPGIDDLTRAAWLSGVLTGLVQPLNSHQRHAVIKLDAWAARDLTLIRQLVPDTPWAFLFRDPVEVAASQLRLPGLPALAGGLPPELFDMDLAEALALGRAGYCARVFASVCDGALEHLDDGGLTLGYDELPGAVLSRMVGHFGLTASAQDRQRMAVAAERDAKRPERSFDRSHDAPPLDDVTRERVTELAGPAFDRIRTWAEQSRTEELV